MLTKRQEIILKGIIEEYIKTALPVGSKKIQEVITIKVSSATIRNESAFLEETGFLEKEHTSSGRMPSTKGYRYYVDNLMEENHFDDAKRQIEEIFKKRNSTIDEILEQTSHILSEMTKLATVYSTSSENSDEVYLLKIELIPISNESAAVVCVLSNGRVENKVYSFENVSLDELNIAITLFNERLINSKLTDIKTKTEAMLPVLKKQVKKYEFVLQTFISTLIHAESNQTKTTGMQYLLQNPEFNDPIKIKEIINLIENVTPFSWYRNQSNHARRAKVAIGLEAGMQNDDIVVIGTKFNNNEGKKAELTLVGPKRIEYDKVSNLLEFISKKMEEQFGEQEEK